MSGSVPNPMLAAYRRVSRVGDRAERLISPELQAKQIESYAKAHGLRVAMLDPELDVSGGKAERPILDHVLDGIGDGTYRGVIVSQLDRLSRLGLSDVLRVIERIESTGGRVVAVAENFDASTPEGEMARNMILSMGHMQLRRHRQQFATVKERAVRNGIWPMPIVPLGYRLNSRRGLTPGKDAKKVRRAFEARASGASWSQIAPIVGLGPTGAARLIQNRVYLGEIRVGEWVNPTAHKPIVGRALWEAAQIAHPPPVRKQSGTSLLSGLCRCAGCRFVMTPDDSPRNRIYRCVPSKAGGKCPAPAMVGKGVVEPLVESVVREAWPRLVASASEPTGALEAAEDALRAAEAELTAFQQVTRALDNVDFTAGLRSRVEEVERARREVAANRVHRLVPSNPALGWDDLSLEEKHLVLRSAIGCVWVWKGRGAGRIRVVDVAHRPASAVPGEIRSFDWPNDDLPGELRVPLG